MFLGRDRMRLLEDRGEKKKKERYAAIQFQQPAQPQMFPPLPLCCVGNAEKMKKNAISLIKSPFKKAKILLGGDPARSRASKSATHKVPVTASSCFPMWPPQRPKEEQKES